MDEKTRAALLDWRMQFKDYKTLILTGGTSEDRLKLVREFAARNFDEFLHVNLKNNEEIRTYINENPPGYEAYGYLEEKLYGVIMPRDTVVFFENADACDHRAALDYADNLFSEEDQCFLIMSGDFTDEELESHRETCVHIDISSGSE